MSLENIAQNLESMTIGLDDTFRFHCTACGKCCINREDILLNPRDLFRIAKYLNKTPVDVYHEYCESYIGQHSHIPIVRLKPIGHIKRCPFLKNRKCAVHDAKPGVCALYPLGRYIKVEANDVSNALENPTVQYLNQGVTCGDGREIHTVREWLAGFNIALEDQAFIRWHQMVAYMGKTLEKAEKKLSEGTMMKVWNTVMILMYFNYDTDRDYLSQFEENAENVKSVMNVVEVTLKGC